MSMAKGLVLLMWRVVFAVFIWKAPHIGVFAGMASGMFGEEGVRVADFTPVEFREEITPVQLGALTFAVPRRMFSNAETPDLWGPFKAEAGGLRCMVFAPRDNDPPIREDRVDQICSLCHLPGDSVSLRAAAYRAGGREVSFWMSSADVRCLERLLELKSMLICVSGDAVEVVRGDGASGLLLIRRIDGRAHMYYEYSSTDDRIQGAAFFNAADQEETLGLARAMIGSFKLSPANAPFARESEYGDTFGVWTGG